MPGESRPWAILAQGRLSLLQLASLARTPRCRAREELRTASGLSSLFARLACSASMAASDADLTFLEIATALADSVDLPGDWPDPSTVRGALGVTLSGGDLTSVKCSDMATPYVAR